MKELKMYSKKFFSAEEVTLWFNSNPKINLITIVCMSGEVWFHVFFTKEAEQ